MNDECGPDETFLGYLPLAHIFELTLEMLMLLIGVKVGYSGPNTLTDSGTMIRKGQKGDMRVLQPTAMVAVPVILDRIYKGVQGKIDERGVIFRHVFDMCCNYRSFWNRQFGLDTPILNHVLFGKFRAALGGKLHVIVSGGAPLSKEVHNFLRTCLCVTLPQGYGLTETTGGVTLTDRDDLSTGRVGFPLPDVLVQLQDWKEEGYVIDDPEGPKGEIIIGCPFVSQGYFGMPDETATSFFTDEKGMKWFRTGDIGHMMPDDGTLRVIDRKKDLVKLPIGEYVSLAKVETSLKVHPIVENVCVCADSNRSATVALVVPDEPHLHQVAVKLFGSDERSREELCENPLIVRHVLDSLRNHVSKSLERFEIPRAVALIPEQWQPDSGLVTAALKLRRKAIQQHYGKLIDRLFSSVDETSNFKIKTS